MWGGKRVIQGRGLVVFSMNDIGFFLPEPPRLLSSSIASWIRAYGACCPFRRALRE
jgi:hypothetical protein